MSFSKFYGMRYFFLAAFALMYANVTWAQFEDTKPVQLSAEEVVRLRKIVDTPVDTSSFNSNQIEQHKKKELAAVALGDSAAREKNLREWMKLDEEGAWILRSYLASTERRAESFQIGHDIVNTTRWPASAARMRIYLADAYIDDSDLHQANILLTEAENTLKSVSRSARDGTGVYLMGDTDLLLHSVRSKYFFRAGKLNDAITSAQMAAEKARSQLSIEGITNERHRFMGRNNVLRALFLLSHEQTAAGQYLDAESSLREAYQLTQKFGYNDRQMAPFYATVADLYNATGQYQNANDFARRSERIVFDNGYLLGSTAWLNTQSRINVALAGLDRWKDALENFERIDQAMVDSNQKNTMPRQSEIRGMVYLKNNKYKEASQFLNDHLKWAQANFGPTHHQTALIQGLLASAQAKLAQTDVARVNFEQSIQHITAPDALSGEMTETAYLRKVKRYVLQNYVKLLASSAKSNIQDAEKLFKIADQLNTSSVQQALSEAAVRSGVTVPKLANIIRKEQDAKNEIATLTSYIRGQDSAEKVKQTPQVIEQMRARLKELEGQRKEYKAQIQKDFPEYFQLIQPRSPSTSEVARQLKNDELFLAIIPTEEQTYIWTIDGQGRVNFQSSTLTERDIFISVEKIRKTLDVAELGNRAPNFDYANAHQLYKNLFAPFDSQIDGKRHLIVSAAGALAKLPFAVLPRKNPTSAEANQPSWLIKDVAISHIPNASGWLSLKRLSGTPHSPETLIAWGDPVFDPRAVRENAAMSHGSAVRSTSGLRSANAAGHSITDPEAFLVYSKLPTLPDTREEVLELAKILEANPKEDVILGTLATRQSVIHSSNTGQLGRKQVVVFATHGLLAGDLPHLSQPALAMAGTTGKDESPLLTLEDVLGLKLNADWVVLSACNTAGADGRAEEALSGLARGFFYAGSRSMLVTHWSVESESAMWLTTKTFSAYQKDNHLRRAEALRQAMLETMKQPRFAHPTYWAPYALVGEGGR